MPVQVVFPFGGEVYEVLLPPAGREPDSEESRTFVREEATTVLQCLMRECAQHVRSVHALQHSRHGAATLLALASRTCSCR